MEMLHSRQKGIAISWLLLLLLLGTIMVAYAFTMVGNYFAGSDKASMQAKLYNAAQSGLEWGKTWLLENRADLNTDIVNAGSLSDLIARKKNGESYPTFGSPDPRISMNVKIYKCNYIPSGNVYVEGFPPIFLGSGSGSGTGGSQIGYSNFIDPNRNITFGGGGGTAFLIVSEAASGIQKIVLKTMVVISNE